LPTFGTVGTLAPQAYLGTFKPTYNWKEYGLKLEGEINTNRELRAEVSSANQIIEGMKVILTAESTKKNPSFATFADEYVHEMFSWTASIDYGKEEGSTANTSFVVGVDRYALGAAIKYHLNHGMLGFDAKLAYTSTDFDVVFFSSSTFNHSGNGKDSEPATKTDFGGNYFQRLNPDFTVGSEIKFDNDYKPTLSFAALYKLYADSTLKGKFDTNGNLFLSYALQFNPATKVTFGAKVPTVPNVGKGTVGFLLSFTP